jgi:hypothetical protein
MGRGIIRLDCAHPPIYNLGVDIPTDPPALISKQQALATIGPERLALLRECHPKGFAGWEVIRALEQGTYMSETTRANIIHDGAVAHARTLFPQVMCGITKQLFCLDFDGKLFVRFKLLDENLAPTRIPTGQAMLLSAQGQLLGEQTTVWPMAPMLVSGYTLDHLGTAIDRLVLVLLKDGEVMWQHDLLAPISVIVPATEEDAGEAQAQ